MSEPSYAEERANMRDIAYHDFTIAYGREPTEEEVEYELEALMDRYR